MADDLLGGVLGGDESESESIAPETVAGAEAFATAIAAIALRQDPGVARETEAFLREQTRLLDTQRRHLEEEHVSRLTQLHLAVAAAKRKRFTDYLRNSLYTGIALLVLGLLVAVARMTAEAMRDHGLVVQDFTVQSDLAAWGDVLAKQGHWSDALAKYDAALKYAPHWAALKQARDAAAGKRD